MSWLLLVAASAVTAFLLAPYFYRSWHQSNLLRHIPTHTFADGDKSRQRYLMELKPLLESGYRKYNLKGLPFKVPIHVGGYSVKYRVILPKNHIEEIKHLSNNIFSWQLASRVIFAGDYTGAPDRGPWSGKALRVGIHQNLENITQELDTRITNYLDSQLPRQPGEVKSIGMMSFFIPAISNVINAMLVGNDLASDPEWINRTAEFALDRYIAADDVRKWPPSLASIVAPFIPSVRRLRDSRVYVKQKMKPLYDGLRNQEKLGGLEKPTFRKGSWGFEWLWGGAPEDVTLQDFSDTMMRTIIASIHTSAKTISVAFIDLLTQPDFLDELRKEAEEATDSVSNHVELNKLDKLDCFLKESQRLTPVFLSKRHHFKKSYRKFADKSASSDHEQDSNSGLQVQVLWYQASKGLYCYGSGSCYCHRPWDI